MTRIIDFDECPRCGGTGLVEAGFYPCPDCKGRGEIPVREEDLSADIWPEGDWGGA